MRDMEYALGDRVKLRSGGPVMVVNRRISHPLPWERNGDLECCWIAHGQARFGHFPAVALEPAPPVETQAEA